MTGVGTPLTLGTAGHIDHGKTALVAALTGVDTDRLPEERARGMSIDLGYAALELPSGRRLSVVDVPGHERFVRTMVAGATGVDLFLLTVAADDGVMPQTREHAAVLDALGLERGVVAVTKADLADPDLAVLEAAELLPGVPVVTVSARSGAGLEDLRHALDDVVAELPGRAGRVGPFGAGQDGRPGAREDGAARLHVDRAFSIRGAGTVVTGTLWAGTIAPGDDLSVLPGGRRARVRGVQVHDAPVARALAGQRVAVNVAGLGRAEIARGAVLASPAGGLSPTHRIDAALAWAAGVQRPEAGERVQVHHGTREAPARLAALGDRFWQLRLEHPLVPAAGDRVVVRRIAPPDTLGGGVVLDPRPRRHGPSRDLLARLERLGRGEAPVPSPTPASPTAATPAPVPLSPAALALEERLRAAGLEPPLDAELGPAGAALPVLRAAGRAVRVSRTMHFHPDALAGAERRVLAFIAAHGSITLAQLRDELGTSRKFAQAILEHLDGTKVTRRAGDAHVARGSARPGR